MNYKSLCLMMMPERGDKGKGSFGQGFKSDTMRLCEEALVLTSDGNTRGLAFLSQSTNKRDTDIIDNLAFLLPFHANGEPATEKNPLPVISPEDSGTSSVLKAIKKNAQINKEVLCHLYDSKGTAVQYFKALQEQFNKIKGRGTLVIVFSYWSFDDGDICLEEKEGVKFIQEGRKSNFPKGTDVLFDYSLTAYSPVLYLDT